jgi:hypothetical protein
MGGLADGLAGPGAGIVCLVLSLFQSRPGLFSCCGTKSLQAGNKFLHDCTFLLCPYVVQCIRIFMLLRRFG